MSSDLYEVIDRIGNLLRAEAKNVGLEYGLHPVHVDILSYLARCNLFSDTPVALKEFLGITKGTLSQSLTLLEKKGLVVKQKDLHDKRVTHLSLTDEGRKVVSEVYPPQKYSEILENTEQSSPQMVNSLKSMLAEIQRGHNQLSFGVCKTCVHHEERSNNQFFCKLTEMELSKKYGELICKEHSFS